VRVGQLGGISELGQDNDRQPGLTQPDGAAARHGDQAGSQVVDELIGHLAATIAGATALVDPERIILDGSIGRALQPWLGDLRSAVAASVFRPPDIVVSALGADATVLGAIARALAIVAERDEPPVRRPVAGP